MGQILRLKCRKCGYGSDLWIGAGMSFYSVENVMDIFDQEIQEKIKEAVKGISLRDYDVRKVIGICKECGKISAVGYFKMHAADGKDIEYTAKCPCGADVEKIGSEDNIKCPTCGEVLEVNEVGHWD